MKKHVRLFAWLMMFVFTTSCKKQNQTDQPSDTFISESKDVITSHGRTPLWLRPFSFPASESKDTVTSYGPNGITRNIIQDRKGNIWIASFGGVFRYDGK